MKEKSLATIVDGTKCKVMSGVHAENLELYEILKQAKLVTYRLRLCNQTEKDLKRLPGMWL